MDARILQKKSKKNGSLKNKHLLRLGMRGSIICLRKAGYTMANISSILNCSRQTISKWLKRYHKDGIEGLTDLPRSGRGKKLNSKELIRIEKSIVCLSERKKKSTLPIR